MIAAEALMQSGLLEPIDGQDLPDVARRLRSLTTVLNGAPALEVQLARTEATRLCAAANVPDARRLVDAAFAERNGNCAPVQSAPPPDLDALLRVAWPVIDAPEILPLVADFVHATGYAGDSRAPQLIYLAMTSRLLDRPVNLFLSGPSAAGKNFAIKAPLPLFPREAYHDVAGMSPLAVMYSEETFSHRMVIVSEAAAFHEDGIGASLLRGLAWDAELKYDTVIEGKGVHLYKSGPTGLITTGTKELEPELATRLWTVPVPDDPAHTRQVLQITAAGAVGEDAGHPSPEAFVATQQLLALLGPWRVVVPFARVLAELMPAHEVRIRRDFTQLLTLIRTHALLHHHHRLRDDQDRLVADLADYNMVYDIVGPVFEASLSAGLTKEVRATVEAVARLMRPDQPITVTEVAGELQLSPSATWRRVRHALQGRWLVNDETRKRQPAKLRLGEPLPRTLGLPPPPEVAQTCKRTSEPWAAQALARLHERVRGGGEAVQTADQGDAWEPPEEGRQA